MLAFASASVGQNPTLILLLVAAVLAAAFWRAVVKAGVAAIVIGFAFLYVTGLLYVLHGLQALLR
jgi:hypothetical protein